jgi:hypothetical protein
MQLCKLTKEPESSLEKKQSLTPSAEQGCLQSLAPSGLASLYASKAAAI